MPSAVTCARAVVTAPGRVSIPRRRWAGRSPAAATVSSAGWIQAACQSSGSNSPASSHDGADQSLRPASVQTRTCQARRSRERSGGAPVATSTLSPDSTLPESHSPMRSW